MSSARTKPDENTAGAILNPVNPKAIDRPGASSNTTDKPGNRWGTGMKSPNPKGRPKAESPLSEVRRLAQKKGKFALRKLTELCSHKDGRVRLAACEALLKYSPPSPPKPEEPTGPTGPGGPTVFTRRCLVCERLGGVCPYHRSPEYRAEVEKAAAQPVGANGVTSTTYGPVDPAVAYVNGSDKHTGWNVTTSSTPLHPDKGPTE